MKTLWRKKRLHLIALLVLLGVTAVSGGLALAATFNVESLLAALLWVVLGGPVLAALTLTLPGAFKSFTRTELSSEIEFMNPNTGEMTDNPIDNQGYGIGS